jgi:hypothetical protein
MHTWGSRLFYAGTPLTSCNVSFDIYVNGDLHTWNIDFTVVTSCRTDDNFPITASISFSKGFLPDIYQAVFRLDSGKFPEYGARHIPFKSFGRF